MSAIYRAGFWTDVCTMPDGRFAQVTTQDALVRCFIGDALTWQREATEALGFCRCAAFAGSCVSIHQGQSGAAWLVSRVAVEDLGPTFGVQPVAIDSQYAYIVRSNQSYDRIDLASGVTESFPHGVPGSSQGIRDVHDGVITWADHAQVATLPTVTLHQFTHVGDLLFGQADPPQVAGFSPAGYFTAFTGIAFEPHGAQSGDRYAIVARTPQGAAFTIVPPFPPLVTGNTPPPPDDDDPQEPVMDVPDRSAEARAFLSARLQKLGSEDETRAHSFDAVNALVLELRKTDRRWGLLIKTGGDRVKNRAADIAAYDLGNGTAQLVDVVNNAEGAEGGTPAPAWSLVPESEQGIRPLSQWVAPFGTEDPPPPPDDDDPPPPSGDVAAQLAALERRVAALETRTYTIAVVPRA